MKVSTKIKGHEQEEKVGTIQEANFAVGLTHTKFIPDEMFCNLGLSRICTISCAVSQHSTARICTHFMQEADGSVTAQKLR